MRWLRFRALLLANLALFVLFLIGVLLTGHAQENEELSDHNQPTRTLVQKGSAESRPLDEPAPQDEDPRDHRDDPEAPWPVRHGSEFVLRIYENSLAIAFGLCFALSIWLHAVTGAGAYSEDQQLHGGQAVDPITIAARIPVVMSSIGRQKSLVIQSTTC